MDGKSLLITSRPHEGVTIASFQTVTNHNGNHCIRQLRNYIWYCRRTSRQVAYTSCFLVADSLMLSHPVLSTAFENLPDFQEFENSVSTTWLYSSPLYSYTHFLKKVSSLLLLIQSNLTPPASTDVRTLFNTFPEITADQWRPHVLWHILRDASIQLRGVWSLLLTFTLHWGCSYLQMGTRLCRCRWWAGSPHRQTHRRTLAWWRWGWGWWWP